jgi:hypothetical protein
MKKKKVALTILVLVFVFSLAYRITHPYRQQRVSRLTYSGNRKTVIVKQNTAKGEDHLLKCPEVMLAVYSKSPHHHGEVIHDPFSGPEENGQAKKLPAVVAAKPPQKKSEPAEEDPRARVQRELSRFRVFGSCREGDKNMLFLERGKDVFIVQAGDKIDNKYLVKSITSNSLDLWAEEIQQDIHIDLSDF